MTGLEGACRRSKQRNVHNWVVSIFYVCWITFERKLKFFLYY